MPLETQLQPEPPSIVLDTNAVLDAWLFKDPGMVAVLQALTDCRLLWVASPAMRDELVHTLKLPNLHAWRAQASHTVTSFDNHARLCAEPLRTEHRQLWCSDNDDQVFIDLALAQGARWVLTKDRALLKLARRANNFGLQILPPVRWRAAAGIGAPAAD